MRQQEPCSDAYLLAGKCIREAQTHKRERGDSYLTWRRGFPGRWNCISHQWDWWSQQQSGWQGSLSAIPAGQARVCCGHNPAWSSREWPRWPQGPSSWSGSVLTPCSSSGNPPSAKRKWKDTFWLSCWISGKVQQCHKKWIPTSLPPCHSRSWLPASSRWAEWLLQTSPGPCCAQ